jgi:hypothetical protein
LVCFVDADDFLDKDYFENIIINFQSDVDLLVYNYKIDTLDKQEGFLGQKQIELLNFDKFNPESILPNLGYLWNKVYKLRLIKEHKLMFKKDIEIYEDFIFNTEYLAFASSIKNCNSSFYHYINRPRKSLVKCYNKDGLFYIIEMNKALGLFLKRINMERKDIKKILSLNMMMGIKHFINSLFSYQKEISRNQFAELTRITRDKYIVEKIKDFKCVTISDKVYKFNIIRSNAILLYLIFKIIK